MFKNWNTNFKWCIDNDWQVYIKVFDSIHCKIAIRKGGITTHGKDSRYCKKTDTVFYSVEKLGKKTYSSQMKASAEIPKVWEYLKETYGK